MDLTLLRCHDYSYLIQRWRRVARAAGLKIQPFAEASGFPLYYLRSRTSPQGGVYLSAGIHGDEPAGTEALIRWAEANIAPLRQLPCLLFPCLNPWGLTNNVRLDANNRDLNRYFQTNEIPEVAALKELVAPYRFALSIALHEDYDGHGFYLYELGACPPYWGESLLDLVQKIMPLDRRYTIDGRKTSKPGLVRRKIRAGMFPMIPEAVFLQLSHSQRTFTFETPSEFSLDARVRVHTMLIDECLRRAFPGEPF